MYIIWEDYDYIEKCIEAGINSLNILMINYSLEEDLIHDHYGHYMSLIPLLERYHNDPRVDVCLTITLNKTFADIPVTQAFHNGKEYLMRTPCPTSEEWIISRLKKVEVLCNTYNIKNVQFDVEHYGAESNKNIEKIWDDKWFPEYKCHCTRCKDLSKREQWKRHNKLFKKHLSKIDLNSSGQLAYFNMWNFSKYIGNKWLYTENTYPTGEKPSKSIYRKYWKSHWGRKLWSMLFYGNDIHICAGLWLEKFTADDFIKWLKMYGECSLYEGYWLYPQARLSKNTRFPRGHEVDPKYGDMYRDLIDDPKGIGSNPFFFNNLKEANKHIDDYRKSFKFKAKRLLWL